MASVETVPLKSALRRQRPRSETGGQRPNHPQVWIQVPRQSADTDPNERHNFCDLCITGSHGHRDTSAHGLATMHSNHGRRGYLVVKAAEISSMSKERLGVTRDKVCDEKLGKWQDEQLWKSWQRYLGAQFQPISSHDWKCNCSVPQTVQTNERRQRRLNYKAPIVYSKSIIVPSAKSKLSLEKGVVKLNKPFIVSGPHRSSKGHLQRWPQEGELQNKLRQYRVGAARSRSNAGDSSLAGSSWISRRGAKSR